MEKILKSIAFFDVDHTLVDGNTGLYTSLRLLRHRVLKKRRLFQAGFYTLMNKFTRPDVDRIYRIAIADMAGLPLEQALNIGKECLDLDIKPRLFHEIVQKVEEHKERGDIVILLTSGPYMLIQNLQEMLGADDYFAAGPESVDGVLVNQMIEPLCYGTGKIHYAKVASQKYQIPLSRCFFYSDAVSDLPLMEQIGFPRPVNPDKKLEKIALQRDWPILRCDR